MSSKIYPYKTINICLNEEGDGFVNDCNLDDIISKLKYMGISQEEYKKEEYKKIPTNNKVATPISNNVSISSRINKVATPINNNVSISSRSNKVATPKIR